MTVTRKVEEIIERGGAVKSESKPKDQWRVLCQKVRVDILHQVDSAVSERAGMNRSAWIQEAIQEKLKRLKDVQ